MGDVLFLAVLTHLWHQQQLQEYFICYFRGWPIGKTMCILAVTLRWMFVFTGYLQLSLIAFSRFIMLRSPREDSQHQ